MNDFPFKQMIQMPVNMPGYLYAGHIPGYRNIHQTVSELRELSRANVNDVIMLCSPQEVNDSPYADLELIQTHWAGRIHTECQGVSCVIPDMHPPTLTQADAIVSLLDQLLSEQKTVYIHCMAGLGRTGTVLALYLYHRLYIDQACWGDDPRPYVEWIRSHYCSKAIETEPQVAFLKAYFQLNSA